MSEWRPGERKRQHALEGPFDGVPKHLVLPLYSWCEGRLAGKDDLLEELYVYLRIPGYGYTRSDLRKFLGAAATEPCHLLLDILEFLIEHSSRWSSPVAPQSVEDLDELLARGNSLFRVADDRSGLQMRVLPAVKDEVQKVVDSATDTSAGEHLAAAWGAAYARTPDPVKSYSESIKAVEAAMAQHISPQNNKQTLGTMIRNVSDKPTKWTCVLPSSDSSSGVQLVLALMTTLWKGQTSRHGGIDPTDHETPDEARAAVHLAATLVQLATSGAFRPSG
ncbi:hypothetical protein [Luteipulveratus halotolerans]|uniref:hypothetical protein n=1 Tax=Luteipulveratus halotolerans TaxID=1631356 RepID=UPI000681D240|nr:hypothetical protein [Luteipulveratus halotolerans]